MTRIDPANYSALVNFFRGYLHQDAVAEHGSFTGAAQAFRKDAGKEEIIVVRSELDRLLSATNQLPASELVRILEEDLGCSWRFRGRDEIVQLLNSLR